MILRLCLSLCLFATASVAGPDDDAAAAKGVKPPGDWAFAPQSPLSVHSVHGLWYGHYDIERGLARYGGARISTSWHHIGGGWGHTSPRPPRTGLIQFPGGYYQLMTHHLVVVANIDGRAFGPILRKRLKDYVERGGAMLFLGGKFAFGELYRGTALAEIAPVTFSANDLVHVPEGLPLRSSGRERGGALSGLAWQQEPRVFWIHNVTPNPDAEIVIKAGDHPVLIQGRYGKGRVAVFAGSVMGDPSDGQLPFWEWDGWTEIVSRTVAWLTEPTSASQKTSTDVLRQFQRALTAAQGKQEARLKVLSRFAGLCDSRQVAEALLDAVSTSSTDLSLHAASALYEGVRSHVGDGTAAVAKELVATGRTHQAALGLSLLGLCKAEGAVEALTQALKSGNVEATDGGLLNPAEGGLDEMEEATPGADLLGNAISPGSGTVETVKYRGYVIRMGAMDGLGNLGNAEALPLLRREVRKHAANRTNPEKLPTGLTQDDELYQESILAALRGGDAAFAAQAVDLYLENLYITIRIRSFMDSPDYGLPTLVSKKKKMRQDLPRIRARLAHVTGCFSQMPASVLPALAERFAAEADPRAIPIAFALFGKNFGRRAITPEVKALLAKSTLPAIAALARQ